MLLSWSFRNFGNDSLFFIVKINFYMSIKRNFNSNYMYPNKNKKLHKNYIWAHMVYSSPYLVDG
jgi:hypothetical protein